MLFNSYEFIFIFFPLTYYIYFYLNEKRLESTSNAFLVVASLFFYSWWNPIYLPLILISMLFNYTIGKSLTNDKEQTKISKKNLLTIGILCNVGLLGYFKYSDFFISNVNFALKTEFSLLNLSLPLAISFFTFQQIAYLVDSYRGETKEYNFINYAVFVVFFPQLIAGPIVHHKNMIPQFVDTRKKEKSYENIALGLFVFSIGLFKKVIIADTFAEWANAGFDKAEVLNFFAAWATSLSYTFQLYFDFSGYTDMATGTALFFNIKLPINFNSPYKAKDIQDFWRRWHITLSKFLRDYVYIPLGGNKKGEFRTYINLMATFLIGGFWHGAGWTFVFWGFLHGLALVVHRLWKSLGFRLWGWISWLITFNFINICWVFFRANNWYDAMKVLKGMFSGKLIFPYQIQNKLKYLTQFHINFGDVFSCILGSKLTVILILLTIFFVIFSKNSNQINFKPNSFYKILLSFFLGISIIRIYRVSEFLYFNF